LWQDLSSAEKAIFTAAAAAENDTMHAEFNANNARALDTLINEHGVKLHRFNDAILTRMADVSAKVLAEAAATDDLSKRVFDSFSASRAQGIRWGHVAEQAFASARALASK